MHDADVFFVKVFLGVAIAAFIIIFFITASELVYDTPSLFDIFFSRRKPKTKRLCSAHVLKHLKPGAVALLDPTNCDICKKETKK